MGLFKSAFEKWLGRASYDELLEGYEERRVDWLKKGDGDITFEMKKINEELVRRSNEKYEHEHPNAQPIHREHGRYLPNDD